MAIKYVEMMKNPKKFAFIQAITAPSNGGNMKQFLFSAISIFKRFRANLKANSLYFLKIDFWFVAPLDGHWSLMVTIFSVGACALSLSLILGTFSGATTTEKEETFAEEAVGRALVFV